MTDAQYIIERTTEDALKIDKLERKVAKLEAELSKSVSLEEVKQLIEAIIPEDAGYLKNNEVAILFRVILNLKVDMRAVDRAYKKLTAIEPKTLTNAEKLVLKQLELQEKLKGK